ncbi:MAG: hypothetical protein ACREKR_02465 [Candidatus Methylomirabilales bacterium]
MTDPFHEAREALNLAKREYTSVNSLNVMATYTVNQACENAVRALWQLSTGSAFPHEEFRPFHKPAAYVRGLGIEVYYSAETQAFLKKLEGFGLDEARYEGTQAYKDHTKPSAQYRGNELIARTERFIRETEELSKRQDVLAAIRASDKHRKTT